MLKTCEEQEAEEVSCTSPEITDIANKTVHLLPERSRRQYDKAYSRFKEWCESKEFASCTEKVILEYFTDRATKVKPTSLWAEFSMIRALLSINENIDIKEYKRLTAFLKRQSVGYQSQKSKSFTREHLYTFLKEAPDRKFLMKKVVAIFGIAGGCRRDELQRMTVDDIEEVGSVLIVKVPKFNSVKERRFFVKGDMEEGPNLVDIFRRYASLRPSHTPHKRFFVSYRDGKCTIQPVGINSFARVPFEIAKFLGLDNLELYTGHSFRKSSATLLVDLGAQILNFKCNNDWTVATVSQDHFLQERVADIQQSTGPKEVRNEAIVSNLSPSIDTLNCANNSINPVHIKEEEEDCNDNFYSVTANEDEESLDTDSNEVFQLPASKKRKKLFSTHEDKLEEALRVIQQFATSMEDHDCSKFTQYVANKMRSYSSRTRAIVEHKISNVLFEADMGMYENAFEADQDRTQPSSSDLSCNFLVPSTRC